LSAPTADLLQRLEEQIALGALDRRVIVFALSVGIGKNSPPIKLAPRSGAQSAAHG
jgi:hypothetical protein